MQFNRSDDIWSIKNYKEQCIEAIKERQQPIEIQYLSECNNVTQNVFHNFLESASSITKLHQGKYDFSFMYSYFFVHFLSFIRYSIFIGIYGSEFHVLNKKFEF